MNSVACLLLFITVLDGVRSLDLTRRNKTELFRRIISAECAEFGEVVHGTVSKINATSVQGVHIECDEGYDLIGGPKVLCNDGRWDAAPRPICAKRCKPPPLLRDGGVSVEARQDGPTSFRHGTKAIYSCSQGFQLSPPASHIRACHDGVWTGLAATCVSNGCPLPPPVASGYHVLEPLSPAVVPVSHTDHEGQMIVNVEQRAHYSCNVGYTLQGPASLQCLASGQWNPRQPPKCVRQHGPPTEPPPPPPPPLIGMDMDAEADRIAAQTSHELPLPVCPPAPTLHHTQVSVLDGPQTANNAGAGARLEVRCREGYRDPAAPCVPAVLYCEQGSWVGSLPVCEPVSDCPPPPYVQHGTLKPQPPRESSYPLGSSVSYSCESGYVLEGERTLSCAATGCWEPATLPSCKPEQDLFAQLVSCSSPPLVEHSTMSSPTSEVSYSVGTAVSYSCFQGYLLDGENILSCGPTGVWEPSTLPTCRADPQPYAYLSTSSVLLVSLAVALGVSLILLVVCVVVVCRHQGPKTRPGVPSPSSSTGGSGGHRGGCGGPPGGMGGQRHSSPTGCVATSGGILHDPDRVALIAFADGVQLGESTALPTYEEAVRGCDRGMGGIGGMTGGGGGTLSAGNGQSQGHRTHSRSHWAGLGSGRRPVHVTRQSSSTSHTASLRSGSAAGDSMGSTDTMTPSEVSTTVTLDTVSSHTCSSGVSGSGSGSGGAASCRAICGSLASFDTSSVLNTEGVPLLEESELEEADLSGPCKRRRPSPDPPGVA